MSGTTFDDPNRQAVGLDPIWTDAENPPEIEPPAAAGAYDPGAHTVDEVLAYVDANPDEADAVLAAEKAGKNRSTLVSQLGG